jgi:hypothetical protein
MRFEKYYTPLKYRLFRLKSLEYLSIFQLVIILGTLVLGIWTMPATQINPDNFYYIYLGSMFENCNDGKLNDAYTVGIVMPGIFRILFLAVSQSFDYLSASIIFSKAVVCLILASFCYLCVAGEKSGPDRLAKLILLSITFYYWEPTTDIASFNAEYVCVILLISVLLLFDNYKDLQYQIYAVCLLVLFIINTKIQAIPILFGLVLVAKKSNVEKIKLALIFLLLWGLNQLVLIKLNIGVFLALQNIKAYVLSNLDNSNGLESLIKENYLYLWAIFLRYKILFFFFLIAILATKGSATEKRYIKSFYVLLLITIFVVLLPNKRFDHYQILFLVPLFVGIKNFKLNLEKIQSKKTFLGALFLILSFFAIKHEYKMINKYLDNYSLIKISYPYSDGAMKDLKTSFDFTNKKVYVNGWDYSISPYLKACRASDDYAELKGQHLAQGSFYSDVIEKKYDYIIDTTSYSSIISNDLENSLYFNQSLKSQFLIEYNFAYQSQGLYVFKIK